ncbi:phosphoenolpyruvate carboxykinase (ATP) [bacterium]|nr:MAG: phosphoenolpyruvate carboxykinase (ATP) [bacterium]
MSVQQTTKPSHTVGLDYLGFNDKVTAKWNLSPAELYEEALANNEATLTDSYALRVLTGKFTGRSPKDKFVVEEPSVMEHIDWGSVNQPISNEVFDNLHKKMLKHLDGKKLYVVDANCGADDEYSLPIRVVSEAAYHALFARNMFIVPSESAIENHSPQFTVLAAPSFNADPKVDGTRTETFILCSFEKKLILIGGTLYSGEVKKGIFSVMNYLLPFKGVMPMHCSANVDDHGNSAVYFGLSGTGKTTLSADPSKTLIGDDEHGWSDNGIFNFEGGCYAKTINLSQEGEPLIYATTQRPGTILENVPLDEKRRPIFDSAELTENTRCSYPLDFIPNASETGVAGHPKNIVFLTSDAYGVLPPISKLTPEQAMYHFISGYTAKVAGTERGVTEPTPTFSACFGAPFMPLHPNVYAELLAKKIVEHGSNVWLVNTGWTGGPYGVGTRMKLKYTRRMLEVALEGGLNQVAFETENFFGLSIPKSVDGVPSELLNPRNTWNDKNAYDEKARQLAGMFKENFKKFSAQVSESVISAGPR